MAAAKHGIAGGAGDIGVWSLGKKLAEEIFHRAAHVRLGGIEIHGGNRPRQNGACDARLPQTKGRLGEKAATRRSDFLPKS